MVRLPARLSALDDFVTGSRTFGWSAPTTGVRWCGAPGAHAEALQADIAAVLATMGLRLAPDKTLITHIDEGLDFLEVLQWC